MKKRTHNAIENIEDDGYGKCYECKKRGTPECPPSSKCLKFDDRPYFEPKPKEKFTISKVKREIHDLDVDGKFLLLVLLILILLVFVCALTGLFCALTGL